MPYSKLHAPESTYCMAHVHHSGHDTLPLIPVHRYRLQRFIISVSGCYILWTLDAGRREQGRRIGEQEYYWNANLLSYCEASPNPHELYANMALMNIYRPLRKPPLPHPHHIFPYLAYLLHCCTFNVMRLNILCGNFQQTFCSLAVVLLKSVIVGSFFLLVPQDCPPVFIRKFGGNISVLGNFKWIPPT